ncbi:MAG: hypothetical protein WDM85_09385 [Caulobacteraceae bacterium]
MNLLSTRADGAKRVPTQNLARFLLVFSAAAGMNLNLDEAYRSSAAVTVGACLATSRRGSCSATPPTPSASGCWTGCRRRWRR